MLPTTFLRQLIGFYGDSLQGVVPSYLEQAMANFARQQQQLRQMMQQTFSPFLPMGVPMNVSMSVEEMGRQNLALMERAMSMFNPFHRPGEPAPRQPEAAAPAGTAPEAPPDPAPNGGTGAEMDALRREVESLRAQLAIARAEAVITHHPLGHAPAHMEAALPSQPAVPASAFNVVADPPASPAGDAGRKSRNGRRPA